MIITMAVWAVLLGATGMTTAPPVEQDEPDGGIVHVSLPVQAAVPLPVPLPAGQRSTPNLSWAFMSLGSDPEGDGPSEVVFSADGTQFLIAHRDSQNVVVFDAATHAVVQVIPVSGSPGALDISPNGQYVVTANLFEDTASIVDLTLGMEVAVVPVGDQPGRVRITPDGTKAIVGNTVDSDLSVIDIATGVELHQIPSANFVVRTSFGSWAVSYRFTDFAITPDSSTIVFPDWADGAVKLFDVATGTMVAIPTADKPYTLVMTPDGTTAVVSHDYSDSRVTVIDLVGQAVVKSIPSGYSATSGPGLAINHDATKAVLAVSNATCVIDLVTNAVSPTLSTGTPGILRTTFDGQYCVVGNYRGTLVDFASGALLTHTLSTTTPDDLAVSPVDYRAATMHVLRQEITDVINTNGSSGYLEASIPTGPPPEADKARNIALTPDGTKAVVVHNHSQNAVVVDLETRAVLGYVPVGVRPGEVAITPAGDKAVVAVLDDAHTTVIDLATLTATNINISRRAGQVAISPDGQYAYLPVVADGDGVWRVNLNTMAVEGPRVYTGNMGGVGYAFDQASGIALSPDGSLLVTCGTYDDDISIIDTAAWSEIARPAVGDYPARAMFSPDGSTIYVTNKSDNTVSVVQGPAWAQTTTIGVGSQPYELAIDAAGTTLYVSNYDGRSISVIDTATNSVTNTIAIPQTNNAGQPIGIVLSADGSELYVAANGADFHVIDTATEQIVATVNTGSVAAELVFSEQLSCAVMPAPLGDDGLNIVSIAGPGDFDLDGDVDMVDFAALQRCYTGIIPMSLYPPECAPGDFEGDNDIDMADFAAFHALFDQP